MNLNAFDVEHRKLLKTKKYVASPWDGDCAYEVVTNASVIVADGSLEHVMRNFIAGCSV